MTATDEAPARRRSVGPGEIHVAVCASAATAAVVVLTPFDTVLLAVTLPLSIVGLVLWVPVVFAFTDGLEYEGRPWRLAFALTFVVLAGIQVRAFREIARYRRAGRGTSSVPD